jgi:hypothetical protein
VLHLSFEALDDKPNDAGQKLADTFLRRIDADEAAITERV